MFINNEHLHFVGNEPAGKPTQASAELRGSHIPDDWLCPSEVAVVVFVLVREDQNEHGYIDTSITGIFRDERAAANEEVGQRQRATAAGLVVEDEDSSNPEWQVSWKIEELQVH